MSYHDTRAVGFDGLLEQNLTSAAHHVLLVLACHKNDDEHICRPGVERLAEITRLSRRTIFRALRELETAGLIQTQRREGSSSLYTLTLPRRKQTRATVARVGGDTVARVVPIGSAKSNTDPCHSDTQKLNTRNNAPAPAQAGASGAASQEELSAADEELRRKELATIRALIG